MFRLREKGIEYNVAVQTAIEPCIPCVGKQQIVLLKPSGEILDRVQCQMTIKLGTGSMSTDVYREPEPDGARFVVRYLGSAGKLPGGGDIPAWLHEMHDIVFHGRDHGFEADSDFLRTGKPAVINF